MNRQTLVLFVLAAFAVSCGDSSEQSGPIVRILADTNRNGKIDEVDPSEASDKTTWSDARGAIFLANLDDDQRKCAKRGKPSLELAKCNDAADDVLNGEEDLLDLAPLRIVAWKNAPNDAVARVTISEEAAPNVRLFRRVEDSWEAFDPAETTFPAAEMRAGIDLRIEGKDIIRNDKVWDGLVEVGLEVTAGGKSVGTDSVALHESPLVFASHLDTPIQLYASDIGATESSNFLADLSKFSMAHGLPKAIGFEVDDIWNQDYFDPGEYMQMPGPDGPQTIRVFVRASNYANHWSDDGTAMFRPAGDVAFEQRGPGVAAILAFDPKHDDGMDTLNSFGNLEVVPAYRKGDENYPLGRIIRGHTSKFFPDLVFERMVESQKVQPPIYVDTSWLVVAHIDEVITFIPDDTPRGWSLFYADPTGAKKMLDDLKAAGKGATPMHEGVFWLNDTTRKPVPANTTVAGVLEDPDVMATSQRAALKTKEIVDKLKGEVGLTDSDVVPIPFLFMSIGGDAIAFQPGMVNGVSLGKGSFAAPKPHGPVINGKDIFEKVLEDAAAAHGTKLEWIEDWDLLHVNMGEVHCGSNALRETPKSGFWNLGR